MEEPHCFEQTNTVAEMSDPDWSNPLAFEDTMQPQPGEALVVSGTVLRVASLNCLASDYVNCSQYHWVLREYLSWEHRRKSLFDAVATMDPMLLCLQECDHVNEWRAVLEGAGYDIAIALRPSRTEGCLTAWKKSALIPVAAPIVCSFNDLVAAHHGDPRYHRDNIALICHLCPTSPQRHYEGASSRRIVVANTHLYWNPLKPEVKLAQAVMLVRKLEEIVTHDTACLILGDLNSLPNSDVVQFFERGSVTAPVLSGSSRFLCDTSLNRLCRWLRVLGFDTALESPEEQLRRT